MFMFAAVAALLYMDRFVTRALVDVWICFETDSSRKPSLDELSTSKDFEMGPKRGPETGRAEHVSIHYRVQMILDPFRYIRLGAPTRRVDRDRLTCLGTFLPLSKRYVLTVMSYGDTRPRCTHDDIDDSADIEKVTFKSAHETLCL
jgi:hypothetical protein